MKIDGRLVLLVIFFFSILVTSCLSIHYIDSETKIVGRSTDTALNDSALIYGTVVVINSDMPYPNADVWIEGTEIKTTSDIYGKFNLKVLSGTYTVKSLDNNSEERFMMTLKDISLSPNEKIEILFSHGVKVE
jgi:hypothetical protein